MAHRGETYRLMGKYEVALADYDRGHRPRRAVCRSLPCGARPTAAGPIRAGVG